MTTLEQMGGPLHAAEAAYRGMYGAADLGSAGAGATREQAEIASIALKALNTMALAIRTYGAEAGLALLCGRICARMENSPAQAAEFAAAVAKARSEGCMDFLREVARG
jgi:hypothetical protein